ncbi:MAG: hypothetical protein HY343_10965 [Lentisphaerae bacterium]|nr:hypothetical protein [Lentisphaerota bacterium]
MKALEWIRFLETQKTEHGKVLFRVAELANVARRSPHALNVELARLAKKGILARYATGIYGPPGVATPEQLVATLDADAYITGMFALYRHNLITQTPTEITCFTNRRHNRSRQRRTPFGRLVFVCVSRRLYAKPVSSVLALPEQAFCDFVHMAKRQGLNPAQLVTFRGLARLNPKRLAKILERYPVPVREVGRQLTGTFSGA